MNASDLVAMCTAPGEPAAAVIKGRLESEGIPVLLRYESLGPVLGVFVDGIGDVTIMVPVEYAEEARRVLASAAPSGDELGEDRGRAPV